MTTPHSSHTGGGKEMYVYFRITFPQPQHLNSVFLAFEIAASQMRSTEMYVGTWE